MACPIAGHCSSDWHLPAVSQGLQRDYKTSDYSDFQVIDRDGKVYNVHKVVLCHQSKWFENAVKEEGHDKVIRLVEEDPLIVKAMIDFFYKWDYGFDRKTAEEYMLLQIDMVVVADKYMIHTADNLLITFAFFQFKCIMEEGWDRVKKAVPRILRAVYEKTKDSDSPMRRLFVRWVSENASELLIEPDFQDLLISHAAFRSEFFTSIAAKLEFFAQIESLHEDRSVHSWTCLACNKAFIGSLEERNTHKKCDECGFDCSSGSEADSVGGTPEDSASENSASENSASENSAPQGNAAADNAE